MFRREPLGASGLRAIVAPIGRHVVSSCGGYAEIRPDACANLQPYLQGIPGKPFTQLTLDCNAIIACHMALMLSSSHAYNVRVMFVSCMNAPGVAICTVKGAWLLELPSIYRILSVQMAISDCVCAVNMERQSI